MSAVSLRCAVVCPIATGGGVSEAFLVSLDMLRDGGLMPVAIVDRDFALMDRLSTGRHEVMTVTAIQAGGALNLVRQTFALWRAIRAARADLVVLHNGRFVAALKRLVANVPIVAVYHGGKVARFLAADRVITINDDQAGYLVEAGYPAAQIAVVDNALPLKALPPFSARAVTVGAPVVGFLGLLEPAKGADVLIEAIGRLAERGLRLRTLIGGEGSERPSLEALAERLGVQDLVEFRGWISDRDQYFAALDVCVVPSRQETWGLVIAEANAACVPVIATDCLGPKRIVRPGKTGVLVPRDNALALADAIAALAGNPAHAADLARAAHAWCSAHYLYPRVQPLFVREVLSALPKREVTALP